MREAPLPDLVGALRREWEALLEGTVRNFPFLGPEKCGWRMGTEHGVLL